MRHPVILISFHKVPDLRLTISLLTFSTQPQKLDEANWALMIAAKYEREVIEKARSRYVNSDIVKVPAYLIISICNW